MDYRDMAFVVTGAASGIGRATADKLLVLGATVHAVDKAPSPPAYANTHTGTLIYHGGIDVSSRTAVSRTFDDIATRPEALRGLAHCAGILAWTPTTSVEGDEALAQLYSVNVQGTWITNTEFYSHVRGKQPRGDPANTEFYSHVQGKQPRASIVNIGSMASVRGLAGLAGYSTSKHAVLGMSRSLAQDWGQEGVRVNVVAPGAVRTPMNAGVDEETVKTSPLAGALKPVAEAEEIADSILYLLSDQASNRIRYLSPSTSSRTPSINERINVSHDSFSAIPLGHVKPLRGENLQKRARF